MLKVITKDGGVLIAKPRQPDQYSKSRIVYIMDRNLKRISKEVHTDTENGIL